MNTTTLADLLVAADQQVVSKMLYDERFRDNVSNGAGPGPVQNLDYSVAKGGAYGGGAAGDHVNRYFVSGPLSSKRGYTQADFAFKDFIPMPQRLRNLLQRVDQSQQQQQRGKQSGLTRNEPLLGVFPEIGHGYLALGSSLYLWPLTGGGSAPVVEYTEKLDADITQVALVPRKEAVGSSQSVSALGHDGEDDAEFSAAVEWLVVVATKDEVQLLTLDRAPNSGHLRLTGTQFSIPTDGVEVTGIVGSKYGRIFLAAAGGGLSEVSYTSTEGWKQYLGLGRKIWRTECGRFPLSKFVPGFLKVISYGVDLVDLKVDDSRHLLFTLNAKGVVEVYDLGPHGHGDYQAAVQVDRQHVFVMAEKLPNAADSKFFTQSSEGGGSSGGGGGGGGGGGQEHRVIAIEVLPPHESKETNLVAISNYGFRFYLSTWSGSGQGGGSGQGVSRPHELQLRHIRCPPSRQLMQALTPQRSDAELESFAFGFTATATTNAPQPSSFGFNGQPQLLLASSSPAPSSSSLACSGGNGDRGSSGGGGGADESLPGFTNPTSFKELEESKKGLGSTSRFSCAPGAPLKKVFYSNRSLLVVASATSEFKASSSSSSSSSASSLSAASASFSSLSGSNHSSAGEAQRIFGFTEDVACNRPRGGNSAVFDERVCLVSGFPSSPPTGELFAKVAALCDGSHPALLCSNGNGNGSSASHYSPFTLQQLLKVSKVPSSSSSSSSSPPSAQTHSNAKPKFSAFGAARFAMLATSDWCRPSAQSSVPEWLMESALPLSANATSLFSAQRTVLLLHKDRTNACDGVVRLVQRRPVDCLRSALLRGDQAGELKAAFETLGRTEACALSVSLAVGLPMDALDSDHASGASSAAGGGGGGFVGVRQRQTQRGGGGAGVAAGAGAGAGGVLAAGALAHRMGNSVEDAVTRLLKDKDNADTPSGGSGGGSGLKAIGSAASTATSGGNFRFSHSHDGLSLFLSRLLRPLWHTPLVCCHATNMQSSHSTGGNGGGGAGRGAGGILKEWLLGEYDGNGGGGGDGSGSRGGGGGGGGGKKQKTKKSLQSPSRQAAPPAPLSPAPRTAPPLVVPLAELDFVRTSLERTAGLIHAVFRADLAAAVKALEQESSGGAAPPPAFLAQLQTSELGNFHGSLEAKRERKSLLSLYALTLGAVEALSLVQWLANLHCSTSEANVEWRKLNGFTLGQLVVDKDVRKQISNWLNDQSSAGSKGGLIRWQASSAAQPIKQHFFQHLQRHCSLFFTEMVRLQIEAAKQVDSALKALWSRNFNASEQFAAQALNTLVTTAQHWRMAEDVRALDSPLSVGCAMLRELRRADGVVQLCLVASKNFEDGPSLAQDSQDSQALLGAGPGAGPGGNPLALTVGSGLPGWGGGGGDSGGGGGLLSTLQSDPFLAGLARDSPLRDASSRREIRSLCYQLACAEVTNLLNPACNYPPGVFDSSANSTGQQQQQQQQQGESGGGQGQRLRAQQMARQARQLTAPERRELAKRCISDAVRLMSSASEHNGSSSRENVSQFHELLYDTLLELGEGDLLVSVRSEFVRPYLERKGLEALEWRHLHEQGHYYEASLLMAQKAGAGMVDDQGRRRPLEPTSSASAASAAVGSDGTQEAASAGGRWFLSRIECLEKAMTSARAGSSRGSGGGGGSAAGVNVLSSPNTLLSSYNTGGGGGGGGGGGNLDDQQLQLDRNLKLAHVQARLTRKLAAREDRWGFSTPCVLSPDGQGGRQGGSAGGGGQSGQGGQGGPLFWKPTAEEFDALRFSLLCADVSSLYNDVASKFQVWDEMLLILQLIDHKDLSEVQLIWSQIIVQCLPFSNDGGRSSTAMDPDALLFVSTKCQLLNLRPDAAKLDPSNSSFSDGKWVRLLRDSVVETGRALVQRGGAGGGSGSSTGLSLANTFTVPLRSFLLKELEEASAFAHQSRGWLVCEGVQGGRAWVARALLDCGAPYDELYEAYAYLINGPSTFDCCKLQVLDSFVQLVEWWLTAVKALVRAMAAEATTQLQLFRNQCRSASHRLSSLLDGANSQLSALDTAGMAGASAVATSVKRRMQAIKADELVRQYGCC